jgi:MFS transporter, DHA1 family, multidrug resistance protein
MFIIVAIITTVAVFFLPETLRHRMEGAFSIRNILASFAIVGRNKTWQRYMSLQAMGQTGLFTFVSASPFVMQGVYGMSPLQFGMAFSVCSVAFVSGAWMSSRTVARKGLDYAIGTGVILFAIAGAGQLLGYLLFPQHLLAIFVPELIFFCGVGFVLPNCVAGLLSPFPDRAGAATSLAGFLQMSFSAAVGLIVVALMRDTALPFVICTFLMSLGSCVIFLGSRTARALRSGPIH